MPRFFVLRERNTGSDAETDFLFPTNDHNTGPAPHCPKCGKCIGMLTWLPPLVVELELNGSCFGDIAFPWGGYDLLVSERFYEVYQANNLKGLSGFDPVKVVKVVRRRKFQGEQPRYFRSIVAMFGAEIDYEASQLVWREPPTCDVCHQGHHVMRWNRIVVKENTWKGADIFIPCGVFMYLVSERFVTVCEDNDISNVQFLAADEYNQDTYPEENVQRAEELLAHNVVDDVLQKIKPNGELWRYCPRTNELAIRYPDGRITMFRPLEKEAYWNRQ